MIILDGNLHLSGSDLVGHLNCRHLTELEHAAAKGLSKRAVNHDPLLEIFGSRGAAHEKAYIEHLRSTGVEVHEIIGVGVTEELVEVTLKAMVARHARHRVQGAIYG